MIEQVLPRCFRRSSVFLMAAVLCVSITPGLVLAETAAELLALSGIKGGLVVHLGCGAQLRTQRAAIVQGPLKAGQVQGAKIIVQGESGLDILVTVDLKSQKIVCRAGAVRLEAQIKRPLRSITHIGYAVDSALADFAPIEILRH